jgi:hypothetical protein
MRAISWSELVGTDGAFASPWPHDGLPSYYVARHVLTWSAQDATVFCERGVVEGKSWLRRGTQGVWDWWLATHDELFHPGRCHDRSCRIVGLGQQLDRKDGDILVLAMRVD